jgi:hypothetical protein
MHIYVALPTNNFIITIIYHCASWSMIYPWHSIIPFPCLLLPTIIYAYLSLSIITRHLLVPIIFHHHQCLSIRIHYYTSLSIIAHHSPQYLSLCICMYRNVISIDWESTVWFCMVLLSHTRGYDHVTVLRNGPSLPKFVIPDTVGPVDLIPTLRSKGRVSPHHGLQGLAFGLW